MIIIDLKIVSPQRSAIGKSVIEDGIIATTWNSNIILKMMFKELTKTDKTAKLVNKTIIQTETGKTDIEIKDRIVKQLDELKQKFRRSMTISYEVREA